MGLKAVAMKSNKNFVETHREQFCTPQGSNLGLFLYAYKGSNWYHPKLMTATGSNFSLTPTSLPLGRGFGMEEEGINVVPRN